MYYFLQLTTLRDLGNVILYASSVRLVDIGGQGILFTAFCFLELLKLYIVGCQKENRNFYLACLITSIADKRSVTSALMNGLQTQAFRSNGI